MLNKCLDFIFFDVKSVVAPILQPSQNTDEIAVFGIFSYELIDYEILPHAEAHLGALLSNHAMSESEEKCINKFFNFYRQRLTLLVIVKVSVVRCTLYVESMLFVLKKTTDFLYHVFDALQLLFSLSLDNQVVMET